MPTLDPVPGDSASAAADAETLAGTPVAGRVVLDARDVSRALARISHEILERNRDPESLVILGLHTRGVPLAKRIAEKIQAVEGKPVAVGELDVTMYRDDLKSHPTRSPHKTRLPVGGIDGKTVVLVDDVLFSGRTIRAALDALSDLGRPATVRLAVLVDRGHRDLPIRADHVGKNLPSARTERVGVRLIETDGADEVRISDASSDGAAQGGQTA